MTPNARRISSSMTAAAASPTADGWMSTLGNGVPVDRRETRNALDAILRGLGAPAVQKPSMGWLIKWKAGTARFFPQFFTEIYLDIYLTTP